MEEAVFLKGKTIEWAGIVFDKNTGDAEFVFRLTDGTNATVGAWQKEGHSVEMIVTPSDN